MNYSKKDLYQLAPAALITAAINKKQGVLTSTGAFNISTGKFTGRSPKDKFIVKDSFTEKIIDWNEFNQPISNEIYQNLKTKILNYFTNLSEAWVRDALVCNNSKYQLKVRVVNDSPAANLFCYNMFLRPTLKELENFNPEWQIFQAPDFLANPALDGIPNESFAIISFEEKTIIIGGTGYTGEMKKGIFSILNCILPNNHQVLSMHCSANKGANNDLSLFFGLSGTGKTTLSADPDRILIGDDEHGWGDDEIFNFEGGCYAKVINLNPIKEKDIFNAIKFGALLENTVIDATTHIPNYSDDSITPNTRVSYPLDYIENSTVEVIKGHPNNIFFLTCDSFGVLPPIAKLNSAQAMYQFISGYTAKIAGTEEGIKTPKETFSACFGAPFMTLHPNTYALMFGKKMSDHKTQVWLINTGWIGGGYGVGKRIDLNYTRTMIHAVLSGEINKATFQTMPVFGFNIPTTCTTIPESILNPRNTWNDKGEYDKELNILAKKFITNFTKYEAHVAPEILNAQPKL